MKTVLLGAILLTGGLIAASSAGEMRLATEDALRFRVLLLERDLIRERFNHITAQANFAHAEKVAEIDAFVIGLAAREGFDLDEWQLDERSITWRPRAKKGSP